MIRDFSLVFLLLISDRRNLHRDSRRDTEQNVPCIDTCRTCKFLSPVHQQKYFVHILWKYLEVGGKENTR